MQDHVEQDVSIILTIFFMKFAGFWLAANPSEQFRRRIALYYTAGAVSFAVYVEVTDFYYSRDDFTETIYILCNTMTLVMVLCKMLILSLHRRKFLYLIKYMQDHFWNFHYESYENTIIKDCRKQCTYFVCSFTFFAQGTVFTYVVTPIVENIGKNESDRILPFTMWVDLPFSMTPYFEATFVIQVLSLYTVGICYFCFDNLLCIMNLHAAAQFRILQHRLVKIDHEKKLENNDTPDFYSFNRLQFVYNELKKCIVQHQMLINYCEDLNHVFTFIILGQVLLFSILICLVGYEILIVSTNIIQNNKTFNSADAAPTRRASFIFYMTGTLIQLMMFTFSCNILTEESRDVAEAAYSSSWMSMPLNKIGKVLRKDILLIIMRARTPCSLSAGGFFNVSLETYTAVMSTAMSYFTLLRQRSLEVVGV
ncbi:PREDICTED: odorant receptor 49b-like [Polistes canadensis]|uniref:odorant receptor 49b-like n=1 Tax=Polistes canadensis TaxID=91411 RepID=UPI000718C900|nr:PREDICTED: odorant receptor 49b-like [Polistes canadensis]